MLAKDAGTFDVNLDRGAYGRLQRALHGEI